MSITLLVKLELLPGGDSDVAVVVTGVVSGIRSEDLVVRRVPE